MDVTASIRELLHFYPFSVPTRFDALDRLFCVGGTGYHWVRGQLVYMGSREPVTDPKERAERWYKDRCEMFGDTAMAEEIRREDLAKIAAVHDHEDAILAGEHGPALGEWHGFYPLGPEANLLNVPADVEADWLAAARQVCTLMIEYARLVPDQERFRPTRGSVSLTNATIAERVLAELDRNHSAGPAIDRA